MREGNSSLTPRDAGARSAPHTPGPWHYIASTKHHGPYVTADYGGDVCDCYTMSDLATASVRNGGTSYPVPFQGENADANARLIATAPELHAELLKLRNEVQGTIEAFEDDIRVAIGNTNLNVLVERLAAVDVVLAKATQPAASRGEATPNPTAELGA